MHIIQFSRRTSEVACLLGPSDMPLRVRKLQMVPFLSNSQNATLVSMICMQRA
jgi:hypothetical protein